MTTLHELVSERRLVVCLGSGGVGKTTVSAALGIGAALAGRRAVVLTADPARRLADALGLAELPDHPHAIPVAGAAGSLDAMMLEQESAWDRLVAHAAPSPGAARRLRENPFYRQLSSSFAGTDEYLALEQACVLADAGAHDLIVMDTPPAPHGYALLDAPRRIRAFLDRRVVRWVLGAGRGRLSRYLGARLEEASGAGALADAADFFSALSTLVDAFDARCRQFEALLADRRSAVVLVVAPDARAEADTTAALARLRALRLPLAAVVVNRVHPVALDPFDGAALGAALRAAGAPEPDWLVENLLAHQRRAVAEARRAARVHELAPRASLALVPDLVAAAPTLAALTTLARLMTAGAGKVPESCWNQA